MDGDAADAHVQYRRHVSEGLEYNDVKVHYLESSCVLEEDKNSEQWFRGPREGWPISELEMTRKLLPSYFYFLVVV